MTNVKVMNDDLQDVLEREIAAVKTYDEIIGIIDMPGPSDQLAQFRNEHFVHVSELAKQVGRDVPDLAAKADNSAPLEHGDTRGAIERAHRLEKEMRDLHPANGRFHDDCERHERMLDQLLANEVWNQGAGDEELSPDT